MRKIDLTDEGKLRTKQRIALLECMARELQSEGDLVAADKLENLIAHLESEDLFHADHRQ